MRSLDELMLRYPGLDDGARRYTLAAIEDRPLLLDLSPRLEFLAERCANDTGVLRDQALTGFAELLPRRRAFGWTRSWLSLAPVPILDIDEPELGATVSAIHRLAFSLAADGDSLNRIEASLATTPDPFPLALGLVRRPGMKTRLLALVKERHQEHPGLVLLLSYLSGDDVQATISELAPAADESARISLLRTLPSHPEFGWTDLFGSLAANGSDAAPLHALGAIQRAAGAWGLAQVEVLAPAASTGWVAVEAVRALLALDPARAVDRAVEALKRVEGQCAADILELVLERALVDPRLVRTAEELTASDHPRLACLSLALLARDGGQEALDQLLERLGRADETTASSAATAAGHLEDGRVFQALERATEHESDFVAVAAVRGLSRNTRRLSAAFGRVLSRGGSSARAAADALVSRVDDDPAAVLAAIGSTPGPGPGLLALGIAVARTGGREGLTALKRIVDSGDPEAMRWVLDAVYPLGAATPLELLRPAFSSQLGSLRAKAAVVTALSGDRRGLKVLRKLLSNTGTSAQIIRSFLDLTALRPHVENWPPFAGAAPLFVRDRLSGHLRSGQIERPRRRTEKMVLAAITAAPPAAGAPGQVGAAGAVPATPDAPPTAGVAVRPSDAPEESSRLPSQEVMELVTQWEERTGRSAAAEAPASGLQPVLETPSGREFVSSPISGKVQPSDLALIGQARELAAPPEADRQAPAASPFGAVVAVLVGLAVGGLGVFWISRQPAVDGTSSLFQEKGGRSAIGFLAFDSTNADLVRPEASPRPFGRSDTLSPGDAVRTDRMGQMILRSGRGSRVILGPASQLRFAGRSKDAKGRPVLVFDRPVGAFQIEWQEAERLRLVFESGKAETADALVKLANGRLEVHAGEVRFTTKDGSVNVLTAGGKQEL